MRCSCPPPPPGCWHTLLGRPEDVHCAGILAGGTFDSPGHTSAPASNLITRLLVQDPAQWSNPEEIAATSTWPPLTFSDDPDPMECSCDHEYHKNSAVLPVEGCDLPTVTAGGHQEQHSSRSPAAKRRKTAKKGTTLSVMRRKTAKEWDDFECYEEENSQGVGRL
ncbi:uncharacterized protein LOC126989758 isoform X2 [Eriocheir sinensis]|uniref:uncharacterized protein LOC126989758 isoform X2 n=1 Tax=Eriocheir sinensis TaxID=95602 RepID=UPI0021C9F2C1|nr:uncharacterized protein LOC126989758 isoform X2 [Eriocheir sinensis]